MLRWYNSTSAVYSGANSQIISFLQRRIIANFQVHKFMFSYLSMIDLIIVNCFFERTRVRFYSIYPAGFACINKKSYGVHNIYGIECMWFLTMIVRTAESSLCSIMDFEKSCIGYSWKSH